MSYANHTTAYVLLVASAESGAPETGQDVLAHNQHTTVGGSKQPVGGLQQADMPSSNRVCCQQLVSG
jgi:hypothetical protein